MLYTVISMLTKLFYSDKWKLKHGFTIVELMVIVAVIGILASITMIYLTSVTTQTRDEQKVAKVGKISVALDKYRAENGRYPSRAELNPTNSATTMSNFSAVKTALPSLNDDDLTGEHDLSFFAMCTTSSTCWNQTTWPEYRQTQIIYMAQPDNTGSGTATYELRANGGSGHGPGCRIDVSNADPGYALMWYNDFEDTWKFKLGGGATISNLSPVDGQSCS